MFCFCAGKKCYCFELNHDGPLLFKPLIGQKGQYLKLALACTNIIFLMPPKTLFMFCLCLFVYLFVSMTCEMVSTLFNPLIKQLW